MKQVNGDSVDHYHIMHSLRRTLYSVPKQIQLQILAEMQTYGLITKVNYNHYRVMKIPIGRRILSYVDPIGG